jgi:hypothetical protein
MVQHSTAGHSTALHGATQHNTSQHGTEQQGTGKGTHMETQFGHTCFAECLCQGEHKSIYYVTYPSSKKFKFGHERPNVFVERELREGVVLKKQLYGRKVFAGVIRQDI